MSQIPKSVQYYKVVVDTKFTQLGKNKPNLNDTSYNTK